MQRLVGTPISKLNEVLLCHVVHSKASVAETAPLGVDMMQTHASEKLKVFISYSRRDSNDFAEELVAGLELAGRMA
jgi:hypothetical protein